MSDILVSVITVVFNDEKNIERTLKSFFSQTLLQKEIIIIDGGSTDNTNEIISKYLNHVDYYISEKDNGIYDALNKGIKQARGKWINVLNSGDVYVDDRSLEHILNETNLIDADVIYGDAIQVTSTSKLYIPSSSNIFSLNNGPIYRHGCSLVRAEVHKRFLFDLSKEKNKFCIRF